MSDTNVVFDSYEPFLAMWCGADLEAGDLARAMETVVAQKIPVVSVAPGAVPIIWPWLENENVKIMARFYFQGKKVTDAQISDVTVKINDALRRGAHGAQVFLDVNALPGVVEQTHVIRDDLFFNKDLVVGLDILSVGPDDWDALYADLRKINASAVMFVLSKDEGKNSMFVGQVFAMLNAWSDSNKFDLHFAFGPNFMRIEQAQRLVQSVQSGLNNRLKFWVNY